MLITTLENQKRKKAHTRNQMSIALIRLNELISVTLRNRVRRIRICLLSQIKLFLCSEAASVTLLIYIYIFFNDQN